MIAFLRRLWHVVVIVTIIAVLLVQVIVADIFSRNRVKSLDKSRG